MGRGMRRRPRFLAAKLRRIRDGLGNLSQVALVERLKLTEYVNANEISDFERGVREPDLLTLKAYADGAGISVDDLIDDKVDLPKKLPAQRSSGKPQQQGRIVTVVLEIEIKSAGGDSRAENRARTSIEKLLKKYEMKKLMTVDYELTMSYGGEDTELDEQIYALLGAIITQAKKDDCTATVNLREKGSDRYW